MAGAMIEHLSSGHSSPCGETMMGEEILGARGLPGPRAPACAVGLQSQYPPAEQSMPPPSYTHYATNLPKVRAGGTAKAARARKYKPRAGAALNLVSQDRQCEVEKRLLVR